jgi:hypothetical protein
MNDKPKPKKGTPRIPNLPKPAPVEITLGEEEFVSDRHPKPTGRPRVFSQEIADALEHEMINGLNIVKACNKLNLSRSSVYRWMQENPSFRTQCAGAREGLADKMLADLEKEIDEAEKQGRDPQFLKIKVSHRQWLIEKIAPRMYGQKLQAEITGSVDVQKPKTIDVSVLSPEQRFALKNAILAAKEAAEEQDDD